MKKEFNATSSKESMDDFFEDKEWQNAEVCFPEKVFDLLPDFFRNIPNEFETDMEKSTALFCSLILCSGVLPFYCTRYDNRIYEANLYGYIIGSFGSGKGILNVCREIVMPIHKQKVERAKDKKMKYAIRHKNRKSRKNNEEDDSEILPPIDQLLLIPGNNTKANIYKLLSENNGRGIIVETETDTLSSAIKSEHGNHSDLYRAASEHEVLSVSRKSEGTTIIEKPYLSILISSTPNQIYNLISDIENGLYSRFAFIKIISDRRFKNVFEDTNTDPYEMMQTRGELLLWLYEELMGSHNEVMFRFAQEQQYEFYDFFSQMKNEYFEIYTSEMDGVVHRLGLMFTRIAMILSIVRIFDTKHHCIDLPSTIVCNEQDFECAKLIINKLSENSQEVYAMLMKGKAERQDTYQFDLEKKLKMIKRSIDMRHQGYSHAQIAKEILGNAALKGTIYKWLKRNKQRN